MSKKLHSEEYFGESRDFWWNHDFLALMAKRWNLSDARLVLDAGSGVGHWGRALAPHLHDDCKVVGVDQELEWVGQATARALARGLQNRFSYRQGNVDHLDFPDETFDVVTCQTVLIHVRNPERTIQEFMRVLRPGGLLAVAEPNNMAATLVLNSESFSHPIERILDLVKYHLACQRGKAALGEGHNSIGDMLPGYFAKAGLRHIRTYSSDKASPMFAPYNDPEQSAIAAEMDVVDENPISYGDRGQCRKYFLAGGGATDDFDRLWQTAVIDSSNECRASRKSGTYHTGGGGVVYLVSGIKE
ncbi:MAG: class I SAM-dependent methyltransferase [Oligoflexales bacterium]